MAWIRTWRNSKQLNATVILKNNVEQVSKNVQLLTWRNFPNR